MAPTKVTLSSGQIRWRDRITIVDARGAHTRVKLTADTKRELVELVDRLREKSRKHRLGVPDDEIVAPKLITYDELSEMMLDRYPHRERSRQSVSRALRTSREQFGSRLVSEITMEDVELWFSQLTKPSGKPLAPVTRYNYLRAMRQVMNYGRPRGYLKDNPTHGIPLPNGYSGTNAADPFESWEEVIEVADALGADYPQGRALVIFVCATGLRFEEWAAIEWGDFDLSVPHVQIMRTNTEGVIEPRGKTVGSLAPVLMQDLAVEAIRSLEPLTKTGLVFPDPHGRPWLDYQFRKLWYDAVRLTNVRYRPPKQMRHTYATLALSAGLPLEFISKQLRHTELETTRRHYARWLRSADLHWLGVVNNHAAAQLSGPARPPMAEERLTQAVSP
jgi:integrase